MSSSLGGEPFVDARVLLAKYGLTAKKSFGQNFLINDRAFRAIVDAAVTADDDWVVEIGAGLGTLTARLAERVLTMATPFGAFADDSEGLRISPLVFAGLALQLGAAVLVVRAIYHRIRRPASAPTAAPS